jgi:hypothetical protein
MKSRVVGWCLFLLLSSTVLSIPVAAQRVNEKPAPSPLLQLLQNKGILTAEEVAEVSQASSPSEADKRLARLLVDKGLISEQEYKATYTNTAVSTPMEFSSAHLMNAVYSPQPVSQPQGGQKPAPTQATTKAPEAPFIPAVAPLRVLPIDVPKQSGLIPDIKLGSGANMKIYGFYKATAVSETASSGGATFGANDFPLPLLLADTGPTSDPQVRLKARSFRIGMQSEWVPKASDLTVTGRVEGDFEGDYTDVNNRNISSVRNGQFSLRLAWVRLDRKLGTLPWFAEFGQDWSLLSSTLPNLFETTGLGIGMGSLYERIPMFRTGLQFPAGDVKVQPEFAIVLPSAATSTLTTDQRLRFGDRAGAESNQPGLEGRIVFQFPLSHAKGVPPAQLIFSGHHARINEIIPGAKQVVNTTAPTCAALPCPVTVFYNPNVPNVGFSQVLSIKAPGCALAAGCKLDTFFPRGIQVDNGQTIYTGEIQLPTPWVTFVAKFYRGNDMRFFFAGQVNDVFPNLRGLFAVGNGIAFSGKTILFGCAGGTQAGNTVNCGTSPVAPSILQPIGGSGGFAELSFPLSRIFHADPAGLNSGWVLHIQYSTDRANYAEARQGNSLGRTDLDTASLTYRLNKWVTFVHETSYIVTFTANTHEASGAILPFRLPFMGIPTRQAHNWRNEFGPVFTF